MNFQWLDMKRIFSMFIGTLLLAVATNGVLVPSKLLSGGISGISLLIHFLLDFKVSLLVLLLNIPIFLLGLLFLRKTYLFYSLLGMLMLSFWLEVTTTLVIPTGNILTIVLVGGVIHGLGSGIIFRADGSTGGTDILAKIVNKYFSINMATILFSLNLLIIILSIYFFGLDIAVLTLTTMFISSQVTNFVVDGINHKRTLFIITNAQNYQSISDAIIREIHRGVTVIPAMGAYTQEAKYILYTTISIREVAKVKQITLKYDPKAFMTVSETSQVVGNGRGFIHSPK
ncbi:membrane protein [Sporanaerobium hydrogeniformans]|uniref:Membrane protein n=1 Tax=Sporanaerobium hydrogeniformans TaxID=3072179 RepID=A0AC61DG54_9FIRM|nr:YitT family protein [Sporanaerobium hydrogeniformans]PHV71937.1 membrane protein [Sporanaerobium hydrogeniformans]